MNKKLTPIFILVFASLFFAPKVYGVDFVPSETLRLDRSIAQDDTLYTLNREVVIVPITLPQIQRADITGTEWAKGIYYYTIQRLGYSDSPFHYFVTSSGEVIKGTQFGDEKQTVLGDFSNQGIVIAYLAEANAVDFTAVGSESLKNLLIEVCNRNAINPANIALTGIRFERDRATKSVEMVPSDLFGTWAQTLVNIKNNAGASYAPQSKTYSVEVSAVNLPSQEVDPSTEVSISLTLKNTGETGIYGGTENSLYLTKADGGRSNFYLNTVWASQSQVALMPEEMILRPGKEVSLGFKIKVPLFVGGYAEQFTLRTQGGQGINTNPITINLNIKRADRQIVEIKSTYGTAFNVRAAPSASSELITIVSAGERFFLLEERLDTLWARIDLLDGRSGWIALWHLQYI